MNARRSPGWILSNHTEDQGANLFAYTLPSSYLADSGDPRPIQTKSRSMPVHDGSRSDQDEQPRTVCARQSIDGEVVARAEPAIADGEPGFRGRGPPGNGKRSPTSRGTVG